MRKYNRTRCEESVSDARISALRSLKRKKSRLPSRHGFYLLFLMMLILGNLLLFMPVIWLLGFMDIGEGSAYGVLILAGLILGYISNHLIDKAVHKEKNEVVAGAILPLLPSVALVFLIELLMQSGNAVSVHNALLPAVAFYVAFNIRFIIEYFEHRTHKHYLGVYLIALACMVGAMMSADAIVASMTLTIEKEVATSAETSVNLQVKDHVLTCIEDLADDKLGQQSYFLLTPEQKRKMESETEDYLESSIYSCLRTDLLKGVYIEYSNPKATVVIGQYDASVSLHLPTEIIVKGRITTLEDYFVRLE